MTRLRQGYGAASGGIGEKKRRGPPEGGPYMGEFVTRDPSAMLVASPQDDGVKKRHREIPLPQRRDRNDDQRQRREKAQDANQAIHSA
jgi:hypothetical protein